MLRLAAASNFAFLIASLPFASVASTLSCLDIQEAAQKGQVIETPFRAKGEETSVQQFELLRKAVVIAGSMTSDEVANASNQELVDQFDPLYKNVLIKGQEFQAVDLSLGDNPYVYLFNFANQSYAGIDSADGSISVDGTYCDTPGDIL